jgi:hypothetical protein
MAVLRAACVILFYLVQSYLMSFLHISKIYSHVSFHILKVSVANDFLTPGVHNPPSYYCLVSEIKKLQVSVLSTGVVFIVYVNQLVQN